jgi:hypothetical protein
VRASKLDPGAVESEQRNSVRAPPEDCGALREEDGDRLLFVEREEGHALLRSHHLRVAADPERCLAERLPVDRRLRPLAVVRVSGRSGSPCRREDDGGAERLGNDVCGLGRGQRLQLGLKLLR